MLRQAKDVMLDGREPSNKDDWIVLFNFFALHIVKGIEEKECMKLHKLFRSPLSEDEIINIAKYYKDFKDR